MIFTSLLISLLFGPDRDVEGLDKCDIHIYLCIIQESEMEILSSRTLERSESRRVSRIANAATILRRQSVRSNRKTPRFAILQSARNRTFLRVISNAISSRVRPEGGERGQADRGGGRTTEGSWLAGDNALLCIPLP